MDISKIMDLFGWGNDKPEDLQTAMEEQILPDLSHRRRATDHTPPRRDKSLFAEEPATPVLGLPDNVQLLKVGRCPACGDQMVERLEKPCAWCDTPCHPERDGFHLVHIALGSFQERHCFCCDDCFEAFRRMYPARVHRNCYERPCEGCNFCTKRYIEETDGFPDQEKNPVTAKASKPEKA